MTLPASDFPYVIQHEVIFHDIDVMGHVNNSNFFIFMETARTKYLTKFIELNEDLGALPVILGDARCRFLSPAHYGEILTIGVGVTRFGNKSFDLGYQIVGQDGRMIAVGYTTLVMYDYAHGQSAVIPEKFKQDVMAFQKDWQMPAASL